MSIVRWEPFGEMDSLFNRLMPTMLSRIDKEYLIRAELPAVKKEDVKVTVDDGMITIEGERKQQKEDKNEKVHRIESFQGHFTRSFFPARERERERNPLREQGWCAHGTHSQGATPKAQPKQIKVE
jgi:HSP20 family protein